MNKAEQSENITTTVSSIISMMHVWPQVPAQLGRDVRNEAVNEGWEEMRWAARAQVSGQERKSAALST